MATSSILVVEDEPVVAKDLENTLERLGFDVLDTVDTGEEAVEVAGQDHPDLILMDIKLNGELSGIEAADRIRKNGRIPVIYLTAHQNERILDQAKKTGPFAYLKKPFNSEELRSTIEVVLEKHRDVQEERNHLKGRIERIKEEKQEEVERLAFHDPLTDLPNRFLFQELLQEELENRAEDGQGLGVMFLDLVGFQQINDAFGHSYGDRVLCLLADKFQEELSEEVVVSRWSGDVFAIMTPQHSDREAIEALSQQLFHLIAFPLEVEDHQFQVFCSVGVAMFPEHGATPEEMITKADIALYEAKKQDSNSIKFYKPGGIERIQDRVERTSQLRRSIDEESFEIYYQPVFHPSDERLTRVEALARWQHPDGKLLDAGEFVPAAESSGLIVQLGELILKRAIEHAEHWYREHDQTPVVAINVSTKQLLDQTFLDMMQSTLERHDLEPEHVELEVTETTLMREVDEPSEILDQLQDIGLRVGVDDFGTGYSSLKYLAQLPVDTIKIDRYFTSRVVEEQQMLDLVEIMHMLSNRFDLTTVVEGVETEEQKERVEAFCDEIQGFYFSKPITQEEICQMIDRGGDD